MQNSCRVSCPQLRLISFTHAESWKYRSFSSSSKTLLPFNSKSSQGSLETQKSRLPKKVVGLDEHTFRRKTVTRDGKAIKILTPVVLSARVTKLAEQGQLQEAVEMVQHSPPDAQNAAVWSNLIRLTMTQKKYKEAYKLFIDMKRRGIRPTIRTFGALLQGYTQIHDWSGLTVQLNNVHNIWNQLSRFTDGAAENEELNIIPFNSLIKIYGKTHLYQKMYDVYNFLDKEGPVAPDVYTFTILLNAIANRTNLDAEKTSETNYALSSRSKEASFTNSEKHNEAKSSIDLVAVANRNASDCRLIWKDLLKTCCAPDLHAIRAVIVPLAKGRPDDQSLALAICQEYLGLGISDAKAKQPSTFPIDKKTLDLLFSICDNSDRFQQALRQQLEAEKHLLKN